jgi:hypothetical protein
MGGYQVFEIEIVEKILVLVCVISNAWEVSLRPTRHDL